MSDPRMYKIRQFSRPFILISVVFGISNDISRNNSILINQYAIVAYLGVAHSEPQQQNKHYQGLQGGDHGEILSDEYRVAVGMIEKSGV